MSDEEKTELIRCRVTTDEKADLELEAAAAGVPLTQLVMAKLWHSGPEAVELESLWAESDSRLD